jgi:hypothetical protein
MVQALRARRRRQGEDHEQEHDEQARDDEQARARQQEHHEQEHHEQEHHEQEHDERRQPGELTHPPPNGAQRHAERRSAVCATITHATLTKRSASRSWIHQRAQLGDERDELELTPSRPRRHRRPSSPTVAADRRDVDYLFHGDGKITTAATWRVTPSRGGSLRAT